MPASKELREEWGGFQGFGPERALEYLRSQRYVLTEDNGWLSPKDHCPSKAECRAIKFLMDEWGYLSIIGEVK